MSSDVLTTCSAAYRFVRRIRWRSVELEFESLIATDAASFHVRFSLSWDHTVVFLDTGGQQTIPENHTDCRQWTRVTGDGCLIERLRQKRKEHTKKKNHLNRLSPEIRNQSEELSPNVRNDECVLYGKQYYWNTVLKTYPNTSSSLDFEYTRLELIPSAFDVYTFEYIRKVNFEYYFTRATSNRYKPYRVYTTDVGAPVKHVWVCATSYNHKSRLHE